MSCSRPLIGIPTNNRNVETGKPVYRIIPYEGNFQYVKEYYQLKDDAILIPCGKCIDCRLAYSRQWADRMMLELETQKKAIFLTLTYNDNNLPVGKWKDVVPETGFYPKSKNEFWNENGTLSVPEFGTLSKRDLQLFVKRMRKEFPDIKLRYFAAGEYGEKGTRRPHYHMILYGISIDDFVTCRRNCLCRDCSCSEDKYQGCRNSMIKVPCGKNELGDQYFTSPRIEKIWKKGNVLFSDVSWKTCAYVGRYVTKKWSGAYEIDYQIRNVEKEFSVCSRNPGIGLKYFEQHPDLLDKKNIILSSPDGNLKINIPSYYLRKANEEGTWKKKEGLYEFIENPLYNPEKYDRIKERNLERSKENMRQIMKKTDLTELDYLSMCEEKKIEASKRLPRRVGEL